jgi:hypothetical protein
MIVTLAVLAVMAQAPDSGAFVVRLGNDTVAVERFKRTADRLEGTFLNRSAQRTSVGDYVITFGPGGAVLKAELATRPAASPEARPTRFTATWAADSVTIERTVGDSTRTQKVSNASPVYPLLLNSYGLTEIMTRAAKAGNAPVKGQVLFLGSAAVRDVEVAARGSDTMTITFLGNSARARVDGAGRILGADGRGTTIQVLAERLPAVNFAALTAAFASRPLGTLSVRDTARATIGGQTLWVDYGRPLARGRTIFGEVVPWGAVWRTGANAATQFHTPVAVAFGAITVPAGTYTLWSVPARDGWTLIINRQTGQWGTEYHVEQDLGRVPLDVRRMEQPLDQFTIAIEPRGDTGGTLVISWENTRAQAAFTVVK